MTDIDRNKVVFVILTWMKQYQGTEDGTNSGGRAYSRFWNRYELFTFQSNNEKYHGYALPGATLNLKRISADIQTDSEGRTYVDNVLVVFIGSKSGEGKVIVGWYTNARVYAKPIKRENTERYISEKNDPPYAPYNLVCPVDCGYLLDIEERRYPIPRAKRSASGYGEYRIWYAQYDKDREIREGAVAYVESVINDIIVLNNATDDERKYSEGHKAALSITARKRSKEARDACLKYYGYSCQICGFDFEKRYGDIGTGFIEVHHINPLSASEGCAATDPIKDLLTVCSNCHSMLHRQKPPLKVETVKNRIRQP
jgi:5-methylcytosine-specific restriction protein A